ncbi:MAG: hypothetical protein WAQ98_12645 [Blastocatellia bacterium]
MTASMTKVWPPANITAPAIYVGDDKSPENITSEDNISGVLNVAYEINDKTTPPHGVPKFQYAKVGMIDGLNPNTRDVLLAAVLMVEQLAAFPPDQHGFPRGANLLIHCEAGHSRSVTVAALYIWYKYCSGGKHHKHFPDFTHVYNMVEQARGDHKPSQGMQDGAMALVKSFSQLFPLKMS